LKIIPTVLNAISVGGVRNKRLAADSFNELSEQKSALQKNPMPHLRRQPLEINLDDYVI
jgi:hypothetical protein